MKTRRFVLGILLLALLLVPSGLRASGSRLAASSCLAPKSHRNTAARRAVPVLAHRFESWTTTRAAQAQRMHRNRSKRINVEPSFIAAFAPGEFVALQLPKPEAPDRQLTGPNPSRAPPSLLSA